MRDFDLEVTYLELAKTDFRPKWTTREDVSFSHMPLPMPEVNRFFYMAVGGPWFWTDRRPWTLARWQDQLADSVRIETWILSVGGVPAGYVELERRDPTTVEIDYLGLLPGFIGKGVGAHLLSSAAKRAFEMGAERVLLNTCNLDHPAALANYTARGFKPVRTESRKKQIPDVAPGPWEGS
ncbi:MAG: GNAT family N-acetyltransferase [Candidatus Sericytochromatia bacterium]|uniref:GNAT family N-acetyltransferase n=1 Tax=Candidatus Tanganyikabacteria bacterium TaxID=2961651 RepID=A0A938BNT0_9BACT|nr:GNAT family N-acetyltransferase [Candidatus Tanganyikabacteria bacterium]